MKEAYLQPIIARTFQAGFIAKVADIKGAIDKNYVLKQLRPFHEAAVEKLGYSQEKLYLAEQIHAAEIAEISPHSQSLTEGVDGLMTKAPGLLLGIHVADCGALYLADPVQRAIALLHSGKKGTELNILGRAIEKMTQKYGTDPKNLIVALSPCIRPPHYEIDFAAAIRQQALDSGIQEENYHDSKLCTASDPSTYYSYRMEKGNTGRMLALLGIPPQS